MKLLIFLMAVAITPVGQINVLSGTVFCVMYLIYSNYNVVVHRLKDTSLDLPLGHIFRLTITH